jgi:hypothetical protein
MLGEEHIFCMLENKVQRKIFGAEKNESGHKFRILHYEELCDSYRPSGIVSVKKSRNYDGLGL